MARIPANNNQPSATNHSFNQCPFREKHLIMQLPTNPTLQDLVNSYINDGFQAHFQGALDVFRQCPNYMTVVRYAGLAKCPVCNHTYPHQKRVDKTALPIFSNALCQAAQTFQNANDFDKLWGMVNPIAQNIKGIGNLTCYDAALRISAYLRILPQDYIYAYQGATVREGQPYAHIIPITRFNPILTNALTNCEIEDFLCVFEDDRFDIKKRPNAPRVLI